jgi:hypothetical protein
MGAMGTNRRFGARQGIRLAAIAFVLLSFPALRAADTPAEAPPLPASQFAALVARISEEGGYFWNENYVSNEASYLHPLSRMRQLGIHGGIYVGVGPNQNFTYIAKLRPRYAFVLDIRRQNLLQHLFFKALFHLARDRRDYLSLLLSIPVRGPFAAKPNCDLEQMVAYFRSVETDGALYDRTRERVHAFLTRAVRVPLSGDDFTTIDKIHRAFYLRGLAIKYDYVPVPTYGEFLLEKDLEGNRANFLGSDLEFRYLKRLQEENRIIPVVGDFAGDHALGELGRFLKERGEKVTVFYASNVEQYLMRNRSWPLFIRNLELLPLDERAVIIRAYWSQHRNHPENIPGYRFTQVLQWLRPSLAALDPRHQYNYWDLVTENTIPLR